MMTNEDFKDWLYAHGCKFEPVDGINRTGWSMKVINPKTGRYAYISGPFDDRRCPKHIIESACANLGIEQPSHTK